MNKLFGFGPYWFWGLLWVLIGIAIVFKPIYNRFELIFKGFIVLMTISLVGTALWVGPNISGILKGTFAFQLPPQQGPFSAIAVAMAMVGAVGGSLLNLVYPYFLKQKGWNGPEYRRVQTYDFILAVVIMIIFVLSVWTLGAELVHTSGKKIADLESLTSLLSIVLGEGGKKLFYLGMFGAVYTSLLGNGLGLGYLASHAYQRWRAGESKEEKEDYRTHPMYRIVALWIMLSPFIWIFTGKADFVTLTLLANTLMAVLIPALAGGLWWITANKRFIGEKYRNNWWENLLMGFLFILAVWGAWESAKSVIEMVGNMIN
jgi:Mn2+/Fe2+ NRAMP family transporter